MACTAEQIQITRIGIEINQLPITNIINKKQHSAASSPANEASNIKNKKAVTKANDNARRDIQKKERQFFL